MAQSRALFGFEARPRSRAYAATETITPRRPGTHCPSPGARRVRRRLSAGDEHAEGGGHGTGNPGRVGATRGRSSPATQERALARPNTLPGSRPLEKSGIGIAYPTAQTRPANGARSPERRRRLDAGAGGAGGLAAAEEIATDHAPPPRVPTAVRHRVAGAVIHERCSSRTSSRAPRRGGSGRDRGRPNWAS